jgi:two-component system phosphate regulon sensor histidine kinase PhoR
MIRLDWRYHLTRLLVLLLLSVLLGWLLDHPVIVPAITMLVYLAWQFYNSLRLHQWLQSTDTDPPESLGMWSEIFDRLSALQKLNRKRSRQYQELIDDFEGMAQAFPDATLVIDRNDAIRWFNSHAVKLLDLKDPDDRGQTVTNLIREPAFAEWLSVHDKIQRTLTMTCPLDENIVLQINAVRFRKNQRLLILRDVTDVHNTERMRHDLVANVSHELRTPLTVLMGYLEVLKSQPEEANPEAVERMLTQTHQMHAMLEDLLELSRLQDIDKQDGTDMVDVPALLAQLAEQAEDISQGKHKLVFNVEPGLTLEGVEADLKSAFQNLIVNAIHYTPAKGTVKVTWKAVNGYRMLAVKDNGIGIPHRDIPRLTERFYRVGDDRNRKTGGTGLGLAIVKHVLNSHGAFLEIQSELGKGSEFRCIFPVESSE